jgi:hypothetical protein
MIKHYQRVEFMQAGHHPVILNSSQSDVVQNEFRAATALS